MNKLVKCLTRLVTSLTMSVEMMEEQNYLSQAVDCCDFERRQKEIAYGKFRRPSLYY